MTWSKNSSFASAGNWNRRAWLAAGKSPQLSDWLLSKTEEEVAKRYMELGALRASQGVSFSHFLYAITATKEHLHQFLQREAFSDTGLALYGELELVLMLDQFFDRALYYAARGYERATAARA